MDFLVPFTMIRIAFDVAFSQLFIAYFPALLVRAFIDPRMDLQPRFCGRRTNRFNHDLQSFQRRPPPVPRNVAKHPMLDLVPFARSMWIVADLDDQTCLVRPFLQLHCSQAAPLVMRRQRGAGLVIEKGAT